MEQPQPQLQNGYHQNRELAIICALWAVLIFFRLDELIGAVGLRHSYSALALWLCLASLIAIPALLWIWKLGIVGRLLTVGIISIGVVISFFDPRRFFDVLGFVEAQWSRSPAWVLVLGFVISILICLWGWYRPHFLNSNYVKVVTIGILSLVCVASASVALAQMNRTFWGSAHFAEHHYFLHAVGDFGSPEHLLLYECDEHALSCKQVYRSLEGSYDYRSLRLVTNDVGLEILYGDEVVYTYDLSP